MRYSVVTFGCRVNQADSLALEEQLRSAGAQPSSDGFPPDVVVVNTCSVTATADQGARQTIRRIARENPHARIVATGCYATRCSTDVGALPNVVSVVRNQDKLRLVDSLALSTTERYGNGEGPCGAVLEPGLAGRTAFSLRVQTGCDQQCAYCIIPTTRGAGRSCGMVDVAAEVARIASAGYKEIVLTGVHLGSYGRDLAKPATLESLLDTLLALDVDVTFRISSLEPMDCTPRIVDLVASSGGRVAPHFHLPLQHASDRMLALMNRPYTRGSFEALVNEIVRQMPHASIGTDLIVGFPGETDDDFACTAEYLPSSPLSHVHVFPYSDRPGTRASSMSGKVDGAVIRQRAALVREIGSSLSARFRAAQTGSVRPGLTLEDGTLVVTDNFLKVRIPSGLGRNERVRVRITDADCYPLRGEISG